MRRPIVIALAVGTVTAVTGAGVAFAAGSRTPDPAAERAEEAAYTQSHRSQAAVAEQDAVDTATRTHPGSVVDVHLQDEGTGLVWEVKTDDGSQVWEIQVDAASGAVASEGLDD